ncbi:hypothetical protein [Cytophaga aurantiaca]|uniref:hypothetical protein n=1 Tax=Cytophaga aurantiaca TaxID=29530 RepID=UPI000399BA71|nr:hypothetical protein [Cytophaga aurantiaca]
MQDDERLSAFHISLYIALFNNWNMNHFKNPLMIKRNSLMKAAKIGSLSTYTKCLKELHEFDYLNYKPSCNPLGSQINMYSFATSMYTTKCTAPSTLSDSKSVHLLYINENKQNKQGKEKQIPPTQNEIIDFFKEKKWEESEADKFFFHYQSTDWYAGKSKILDWKASAEKWILNNLNSNSRHGKDKNNHKKSGTPGNLHATTNKNYSDPL